MSSESKTNESLKQNIDKLLNVYPSVMVLNMCVGSNELRERYYTYINNHNNNIMKDPFINAGFDIYYPGNNDNLNDNNVNFIKINFDIKCSAKIFTGNKSYYTGYYIHPRSSLSSTGLRLANATGIIDSGYRGNIIGAFDKQNININNYNNYNTFDKYIQICAPGLIPILVNMVHTVNELSEQTSRGEGGFGSSRDIVS